MNKFEKFMVVPYKPKQEEISSNNKISEILSNQNLNKSDKSKLIDQLLIHSELPNKIESHDNEKQIPFFDFNSIANVKKSKQKNEYYTDIDLINKRLNKVKGTKNNAQLLLNPASSTRTQTKNIKNKINISLNQMKALKKTPKKLTQAPSLQRTVKKTKQPELNLNATIVDDNASEDDFDQEFQSFNQADTSKLQDWEKFQI
jgi:hypothetical protein